MCKYAGQEYELGALVCQAGKIMRCSARSDGSHYWEETGQPCPSGTAEGALVDASALSSDGDGGGGGGGGGDDNG